MTAIRSGTLTFTGDAPDLLPAHAFGVFGLDDPLATDEVDYGQTSLQIINPNFQSGNDVFNFDEDTSNNSLNVLSNDQAAPGKTLTIVGVSNPNHGGTVTVATGGQTLVYTPAANFFGEETFTYTVSDGADENVASVTVQVHPVNDPPTAVNDTFTIIEDAQNSSLAVLQNDLVAPDASTEKLIVKSVTQPQNGTVTIENTGLVVRFTPAANFSGTSTFTYTIEDDGNPALTSTATVTVNVTAVNDPPVAIPDTFSVQEDSQNNDFNVLANDNSGPETGETLTIVAVQQGSRGGIVTITENGTRISYTPASNVFGEETFTYTIQDNGSPVASSTATVTVSITATNDPPNATDDVINVAKNSQNNLLQVLNNDLIAPDLNETLTITAVSAGSQGGTVEIADNGTRIRYVPTNGFLGTETFTYTVTDPGGLADTATVTVTVRDFVASNLSGFVYLDSDNDGVKDAGETPISGVQISLIGTDDFGGTISLLATTDSAGAYQFTNLPPGIYSLKETQPTGQVNNLPIRDGKDTIGSQGGNTSGNDEFHIDLNENVTGTNNNFGELNFVPSSLSGFVYHDADNDGVKDSGEQAIANVQLTLTGTDDFGSAVSVQATTDATGLYQFLGLAPGNYQLKETQPTGQINNLPLQDGKDTIGSQGGTVSANDEFTIEVDEGVLGINNNFGEITGFQIGGTLTAGGPLNGVQVELYATNGQNQATGDPLKTTNVRADGSFVFDGVASGNYVVQWADTSFLQFNSGPQVVSVVNADMLDVTDANASRQARYFTYRDFLNSTPRQGILAAVNLTTQTHLWSSLDSSWPGFTEAIVQPTSNDSLRVEVTRTTGEKLFVVVPISDPRVFTLASDGPNRLLRLAGGSTSYNLQPVTTGGAGEGEGFGEGESADLSSFASLAAEPVDANPPLAATGVLDSSPDSLGENNGIVSPFTSSDAGEGESGLDLAFVIDTSASETSSLPAHDHGANPSDDHHHQAHDLVLAADDGTASDDELLDRLAASHVHDDDESALDEVLEDPLELLALV
jgi:hypothetical protein